MIHLILDLLNRLDVDQGEMVLDPFCGTGTTLVECKKQGVRSIGIDANPASVLASRVKVTWDVSQKLIAELSESVIKKSLPVSEALMLSDTPLFADVRDVSQLKEDLLSKSRAGRYLLDSGMIDRGWIDEIPFYISIALLTQIDELDTEAKYRRLLKRALASCIVETVANVRFGPEIYVVDGSGVDDVLAAFQSKIQDVVEDLHVVSGIDRQGEARVFGGDSRNCAQLLRSSDIDHIDHVITSPPYPTEKDYTRNTRLELVYLGFVYDRKSLRRIKKAMVRSHSKGIYKADSDGELVAGMPEIKAIADELREKVKDKTYGFAKMYPRIIEEYFGGMYRHLLSLSRIMRPGGKAAYVVGEQRTYLQTYTPTASILCQLVDRPEIDFRVIDIPVWRVRRGTTGSGDLLKEEILIIQKT
ncbi:MAG TPA: hypothetical protein ENN19_03465 [Chloroflexi bacterium]|nr:hypothetical protein [Chloroflexota bacterium]